MRETPFIFLAYKMGMKYTRIESCQLLVVRRFFCFCY